MRKLLKVCFLVAFLGVSAVLLTGVAAWWAVCSVPNYYAEAAAISPNTADTVQAVAELEAAVEALALRGRGQGMLAAFGAPESPVPVGSEFRVTARQVNSWMAMREKRGGASAGQVSKVRFGVGGGAVTAGMAVDVDGFETVVSMTLEPRPVRGGRKPLRLVGFSVGRLPVPMALLRQLPSNFLSELDLKPAGGGLEFRMDLDEFSDGKLPLRDVFVEGNEVVLVLGGGAA